MPQINIYDSLGTPYGHLSPRFGNWNAKALDAAAIIRGAANYSPYLIGFPKLGAQSIPARQFWQGRASLGERAYILGLSGSSAQAAGFMLQIKDLGTGRPLFAKPLNWQNITAQGGGTPNNQVHYFPAPHLVKPPGLVEIQITNLAAVANDIEVVLFTAQETWRQDEPK